MSAPMLFVRAGAHRCALPVSAVVETMRPLPIRPLAGLPACVRGVAVVRGKPLPVVDLGCLIGGAPTEIGRLVTVRANDRTLSLAVTHVRGVGALDPAALSALPSLLGAAAAQALGAEAGELLQVLDGARLLTEDLERAIDEAIQEARP